MKKTNKKNKKDELRTIQPIDFDTLKKEILDNEIKARTPYDKKELKDFDYYVGFIFKILLSIFGIIVILIAITGNLMFLTKTIQNFIGLF